jgi:cardiolipin synthase A/B
MAKKRLVAPFSRLIKKSSTTALLALLVLTLYQLIGHFHVPQPTTLPSSEVPLEMYSNQTHDNLTQLYLDAINHAKQSIVLAIYALTDHQIIEALQRKSEAGLPVYIVSDAKASKGLSRQIPKATIIRRLSEGLMHQKILVIDGHQILLGSANLTPSSLTVHGNLVFGIDHPAFAEALTTRIKSMDEDGAVESPLTHQEALIGSQHVELWILPDDPTAIQRMIELFRSAKKTIKVAMFTWTRVDFAQELIEAAKRGVRVEAVIDRYSGKGASSKIVRMLEKAGISVGLSTGQGLLHHKFVYIDDQILVNGSANWTNSAFKTNDDYFVVVYPLTPHQQEKMNQLWQVIRSQSAKPNLSAQDHKQKTKQPHDFNED